MPFVPGNDEVGLPRKGAFRDSVVAFILPDHFDVMPGLDQLRQGHEGSPGLRQAGPVKTELALQDAFHLAQDEMGEYQFEFFRRGQVQYLGGVPAGEQKVRNQYIGVQDRPEPHFFLRRCSWTSRSTSSSLWTPSRFACLAPNSRNSSHCFMA